MQTAGCDWCFAKECSTSNSLTFREFLYLCPQKKKTHECVQLQITIIIKALKVVPLTLDVHSMNKHFIFEGFKNKHVTFRCNPLD